MRCIISGTVTSDYLVVGGGSAGCAVAGRLAENPDNKVVLVEAGGPDGHVGFHVAGLVFLVATVPRYNWNFTSEPIAELNGRQLKILHGKVLGGSSSINGMQYTRGFPADYDAWHEAGCEGWGWDDVLPYFKKAETSARGASPWHGDRGPLRTRKAEPRLPICDAILAAAADAGFPIVDDLNGPMDEGFGLTDVNIRAGRRSSSAAAYLRGDGVRKNLTVLTGAQALRIVVEGGRACGVEIARNGVREVIRCEGEIVVCAGAIKSPQLLLLSGIGPADELREFGIPVVVDSPQVGKRLQNHPTYRVQYLCTESTTSYKYLKPLNALRAAIDYALLRKGPLAESYVAIGGFFRTDPSLRVPDIQITMLTSLVTLPTSQKATVRDLLPRQDGISFTAAIQPFSRGEVRLRSADPHDQPRVSLNYFSDSRDIQTLVRAIERMRDIMQRPPIRPYIKQEYQPGASIVGAQDLEAEIRRSSTNSFHPSGTCAMGSAPDSVLDPQLRVRGVEGLRVADNSIMPAIPNAGLHAPAIMIGEKAAALISG